MAFSNPSTTSTTTTSTPDSSPRILCLHGGGSNAEIFQIQLRNLTPHLRPFRLVLANAPHICDGPGPGILPFFEGMGPYWRWFPFMWGRTAGDDNDSDDGARVGADAKAVGQIEEALRSAMQRDNIEGGNGEWVGLLGFSQGAKVAMSVLFEEQRRQAEGSSDEGQRGERGFAGGSWRLAVVMNGSPPVVSLRSGQGKADGGKRQIGLGRGLVGAGGRAEWTQEDFHRWQSSEPSHSKTNGGAQPNGTGIPSNPSQLNAHNDDDISLLTLPTLHVHGLEDERLDMHRWLVPSYCAEGSAEVVEWAGGHRLPLVSGDNRRVAEGVFRAARKGGVSVEGDGVGERGVEVMR